MTLFALSSQVDAFFQAFLDEKESLTCPTTSHTYLFSNPYRTSTGIIIDKNFLDNLIEVTGDDMSHLGELLEFDEDTDASVRQKFVNVVTLMQQVQDFMADHQLQIVELSEAFTLAERLADWMEMYKEHRRDLRDEQVAIFYLIHQSAEGFLEQAQNALGNVEVSNIFTSNEAFNDEIPQESDPHVFEFDVDEESPSTFTLPPPVAPSAPEPAPKKSEYNKNNRVQQKRRENKFAENDAHAKNHNKHQSPTQAKSPKKQKNNQSKCTTSPQDAHPDKSQQIHAKQTYVQSQRVFSVLYSPSLTSTDLLVFSLEIILREIAKPKDFFGVELFCNYEKNSLDLEFTPRTNLRFDSFSGMLRDTPRINGDNQLYSTLIALQCVNESTHVQQSEEAHFVLFTEGPDSGNIPTKTVFEALEEFFRKIPRANVHVVHIGAKKNMEPTLTMLSENFARFHMYTNHHNLLDLKKKCIDVIFGVRPTRIETNRSSILNHDSTPSPSSRMPQFEPSKGQQSKTKFSASRFGPGHGKGKSICVLDTNILSEADCWRVTQDALKRREFPSDTMHFGISYSTLLEIDPVKNHTNDSGYVARNFMRFIDMCHDDPVISQFVRQEQQQEMQPYMDKSNDERIAHFCQILKQVDGYDEVILVSRDTNLRNIVRSFGVLARKDPPF